MQGRVSGNKKAIYWETPKEGNFAKSDWSLKKLVDLFNLKLDPCAMSKETTCCEHFFTPEQDGLKQRWTENWFLNPRYDMIYEWLEYGMIQIINEQVTGVALLPAYTGSDWWSEFVSLGTKIEIRGRIDFWHNGKPAKGQINPDTQKPFSSPHFDSVIVIWGEGEKKLEQ